MSVKQRIDRLERLLVEEQDESRPLREWTDAQLLRLLSRETGLAEEELTDEVLMKIIRGEDVGHAV